MSGDAENVWADVPDWGSVGARRLVRPEGGDRQLREGDVVPLPRGPAGGHQVRNEGTEVVRILIVSTNVRPDVAEYPETGKVGLLASESDEWEFHRRSEAAPHSGPE